VFGLIKDIYIFFKAKLEVQMHHFDFSRIPPTLTLQ